jgi:tetratricopeptide (TPR) repeat protein
LSTAVIEEKKQEESDRLGRLTVQTLAILGGLVGLLIAVFDILASIIGGSSSHFPGGWSDLIQLGGGAFLILSLAGIAGAFLYTRNLKRAAWLLLGSGLLGFPAGYIAWIAFLGLLGWIMWMAPGVLLTAAGLLALITPGRLRSILGQARPEEGGTKRKPIDQAMFLSVAIAGLGLLTVILLFAGFLVYAVEDSIKGDAGRDQDDFDNAIISGSMGRWDKAIDSYDDILSRNQSNIRAWEERAYALEKLGRYKEANESSSMAEKLRSGGERFD